MFGSPAAKSKSRDSEITAIIAIPSPTSLQFGHQMRRQQRMQPTEERKQTAVNSHESSTPQSATASTAEQTKLTAVSSCRNMICIESQLNS
jgi:hypothetical protein